MNSVTDTTPVSTIADFIQLAIAPVFLLAGIGAILNVLANRLARVVDRVRHLEAEFVSADEPTQARARTELYRLGTRMTLVNWSITACTASALFVCLVVAIIFVGELIGGGIGRLIAILFILAMTLLVAGLILFLLEIRVAARTLRVRYELLESAPGPP